MTFHIERGDASQVGALAATGTVNNGLVVYIDDDGHLVYDHNSFSDHTVVRSERPVPGGSVVLAVEQVRVSRGPGRARLLVAGDVAGEATIPFVPVMISPIGFDIGRNPTGVSDRDGAPGEFGGRIRRVEIDTVRALPRDAELALEILAAESTQ